MAQGGTLHLFSSKESEYEMRAMLLKRLSFTIFCSEPDQYSKYFPDIQGQLSIQLELFIILNKKKYITKSPYNSKLYTHLKNIFKNPLF